MTHKGIPRFQSRGARFAWQCSICRVQLNRTSNDDVRNMAFVVCENVRFLKGKHVLSSLSTNLSILLIAIFGCNGFALSLAPIPAQDFWFYHYYGCHQSGGPHLLTKPGEAAASKSVHQYWNVGQIKSIFIINLTKILFPCRFICNCRIMFCVRRRGKGLQIAINPHTAWLIILFARCAYWRQQILTGHSHSPRCRDSADEQPASINW